MKTETIPLLINLLTVVTISVILAKAVSFPERTRTHNAFIATLVSALMANAGTLLTYLYLLDRIERAVIVYYFGICLLPPSLFLVAYYYLFPDRGFRRAHLLLYAIPALSIAIASTNGHHHLLVRKFSFFAKETVYGPWFAVHAAYSFTVALAAIALFVAFAFRRNRSASRRIWLIAAGSLVPVVQFALGTFRVAGSPLIYNSIGFSVAVIAYWFAVVRMDFLNLVPFAYREIMDHVSDGVLVMDDTRVILMANRSLALMFRGSFFRDAVLVGTDAGDFLRRAGFRPEPIFEQLEFAGESRKTVAAERSVTFDERDRHFEVECTPVVRKGGVAGSILLFRDITEHKRNFIELKAGKRTVEELNASLKSLAELDALTGAFNRRFFDEYFMIEATRSLNRIKYRATAQEGTVNFGVAIVDIDDFKAVNDTYGHQAGDLVLRKVVEVMRRTVFERDVICRYGGEEFVVLFTNADTTGIALTAERIREAIAAEPFGLGESREPIRITVSVGLATFEELYEKTGNGMNCIRVADERLYKAKRSGKNRVCRA